MVGDTLPSDWKWVTVDDVKKPNSKSIVSGPFGSNIGSRFFVDSGIPVIRGNNLTTDMTRFVDDGYVFITEEKAEELKNCEALSNDLIFTAAGTLGQVGIIPPDSKYPRYIISNKQMRVRVDENIVLPLFAFYWLSSSGMVEYIEQRNTGSSVPLINLTVLRELPLPLPPIADQKEIIRILSALDDKIELNRRMNHTLESMAQALFKSWFVDFDPVVAKSEGRQPYGMNTETAALFPSEFQDSELGTIPQGWMVGKLKDIAVVNANTLRNDYPHFEINYIDISSVEVGNLIGTAKMEMGNAPSRAKRLVKHGDTIWSCVRPNRRSYLFIQHPSANVVVSTGFAVLSPQVPSASFVYLWVTTDDFVEYLTANAEGSAYPAVRPESFERATVLLPSDKVLTAFEKIVQPLFELRNQNAAQSKNLASIRDALLPRLLSGEIRVKEIG